MSKEVKKQEESEDASMDLTGHLTELRKRIIIVIVTFFIMLVIVFNFSSTIVDYFIKQATTEGYQFVYLTPSELFMQYIRVAIISSIVLIIPVIFYEIWAFIRPALTRRENTAVVLTMIMGFFFFGLGALFAFKIITPFMLNFYSTINVSSEITASISVENYVGFIFSNFLIFGCVFELPVVVVLLSELGILNYNILVKARKLIIVSIFVLSAIITPPDAISQCLCAGPMILLFELSLWLSKLIYKRKQKEIEDDEENDKDENDG